MVISVVVTCLVVIAAQFLPSSLSPVVVIGMLFATGSTASLFQGTAIEEHKRLGGKLASRWVAFGIGLMVIAGLTLLIFCVASHPRMNF